MRKHSMFAGLAVLCTSLSSFAGWEYSSVTRAEGSKHSEMMNNQMSSWVDGDKAKIEFVKSGSPLTPVGSFVITKDGGQVMHMVNPQKKTYSKWDVSGLAGLAGGAMQMMNMKVSTPKVEKLLEEKGEKIAGYATTHYRFRTSYTMEMNFMGMQRSTSTVTEEDIWACPQLKDAGLTAWVNQQTSNTGNEELDKLVKAEMGKVKGFPLRRVMTTTTTESSNGEPQVMKLTTEVTAIKKASPAASLFELPAGYQETPMFSPTAGAGNENPLTGLMQQMQKK
jgi:hypothetical protein